MARKLINGLAILVLFMAPLQSVAVESGPSNTVGFWKFDVSPGYTQVSFPLLPGEKNLDVVLGDQLTGGATPQQSDQILRWDATAGLFQMAWYNTTSNHWEGDFSQLSEAESYWIYVQPDHPASQTIVAYGNVVEEPYYNMGAMVPGYNAVGSVWALAAPISQSGLVGFQGGVYLFLSDLILSYDVPGGSYSYAWMDDGGAWQGDLTDFEPLKGYWIYIAPGHNGFEWPNYPQPNPQGLDARVMPPSHQTSLSTGKSPKIRQSEFPVIPTPDKSGKLKKLPIVPASSKGDGK